MTSSPEVSPCSAPTSKEIRERAQKAQRRQITWSVLLISLLLHGVIALVAGLWIVAVYFMPPPATFQAKPVVKIPPKILEEKLAAAAFDSLSAPPAFDSPIVSTRPTDFALPDLPSVSTEMPSLDLRSLLSESMTSLAGEITPSSANEAWESMGSEGNLISFLGVQATTKRVVLMYDISTTVTRTLQQIGIPMEKIRGETIRQLDQLSVNTRFNLVQFARNYAFFRQEKLVPASPANLQQAKDWLHRYFAVHGFMPSQTPHLVRGGPGFLQALQAVLEWNPDLILIISDGNFYRNNGTHHGELIPPDEIQKMIQTAQKKRPQKTNLFFITAGMPSERQREWRHILRSGGGKGKVIPLEQQRVPQGSPDPAPWH